MMKCEYCDRMNTTDTTVCKYCGAPLSKENQKQIAHTHYSNDIPVPLLLFCLLFTAFFLIFGISAIFLF